MNTDEFAALRTALTNVIPDTLPPKVREAIALKFNYLNSATLAERLEGLLNASPETVLDLVIRERDRFRNAAKWTRNYYTHYLEEDRRRAAHGVALVNLTDQARWLVAGLLLKRLGLPGAQVEAILRRSGNLRRAARWH